MSGPDPDVPHRALTRSRRDLTVVAGHIGDLSAIRRSLEDPDPAVRIAAIGAAARNDLLEDATMRRLLADPDRSVRRRAALAAAGVPVALDALVARLGDDEATVVEVAAFACGERPDADPALVDALVTVATGHEDHLCREAAVAALGSVAAGHDLDESTFRRARSAVLAGTGDRATVRRRAVLALAAFDGDEVGGRLRELLGDRDLQVRQAAEDLVAIEDGEDVGPGSGPGGPHEDDPS